MPGGPWVGMQKMESRKMGLSDGQRLCTDVNLVDVAELNKLNESVGSKSRAQEKWARALSFSPFVAFVLDASDNMPGFGRIESDGEIYILYDMFVTPSEQGKGIGSIILESLINQAQNAGVSTIGLSAWTPKARQFYLKHGFIDKRTTLPLKSYMELGL